MADPHKKSSDAQDIQTIIQNINTAWTQQQFELLERYLDEDIVMSLPGFTKEVTDRAQIIDSYRDFMTSAKLPPVMKETMRKSSIEKPRSVCTCESSMSPMPIPKRPILIHPSDAIKSPRLPTNHTPALKPIPPGIAR